MSREHRFFTTTALAASAVIVIGFASTYGARLRVDGAGVPLVIHLHAVAFSAWLLLFVAQSMLVSAGRVGAHRRLGFAGGGLTLVMLALGVAAAASAGRHGHRGLAGAEFATPAGFVLFSVLAVLSFFALTAAALWWRGEPKMHKRLMLLGLVGALLPPGLSRVPWLSQHLEVASAVWGAFVLAGPVFDLVTERRVHPAWWWGAPCVAVTFPPLSAWLATTGGGQAVVRVLLG